MRIELQDVLFRYPQFGGNGMAVPPAIQGVHLKIDAGELIGIVGASGSGKTTLVQFLNGLLVPDQGVVLLDGKQAEYRGRAVQEWRKRVGLVFQFPEMQFFENTVFDEVAYALRNLKVADELLRQKVEEVLQLLDLPPAQFAGRSPFDLSEGQKRRVAIASILVLEPEILIFDEPTAGLDYSGIQTLKKIIQNISSKERTVLIVSHDMDFIAEMVNRIVALQEGKILFDGSKADFFANERLVQEAHLKCPHILSLAQRLISQGKRIPYPIFSLAELKNALQQETSTR